MSKENDLAREGEAGVQLGGESGPNNSLEFFSQYWRAAQAEGFRALAHTCPAIG